jgi:exonuclease SbcC
MIEKIKIANFQSHKDSVLNLHEGINVLTGPTDNGKTSIVRALNWVVNNEPKGDSFRSNWGGETCVEINMDIGSRVERIKDKGVNLYRITFSGLYEDFKSFGLGVPEEVTEHLNILPINMQFQMDSPFMLSQTPGEVARYLNEIVNLQDIDISVYNLNKISRENNQRLSNLESQLYTQKESLKEYNWIRSADIKLKKVEKLEQEMEDLQERKNRLGCLLEDIKETNKNLDKYINIGLMKKKIACLEELLVEIVALRKGKEKLSRLIAGIEETGNNIKSIQKELADMREKFNNEFPDICPLCEQEVVR